MREVERRMLFSAAQQVVAVVNEDLGNCLHQGIGGLENSCQSE
jgi:hypothetical protein